MTIILTEKFKAEAKPLIKKYHSLLDEIDELINSLIKDPKQGEPLGKDCYKIRLAIKSKGKGKSGGARVITCVKIVDANVYLLTIYDKAEKDLLAITS
jgi:mRNA-degrading endonuclease RelE of RelBE toxin-antitoxin system